jgi:photosystem II stability/assembly factor-like uncharacterized protein
MLTSIRYPVRWTLCEKPLLSFVIVALLVFGGSGGGTPVSVAQEAQGWDALGAHQAFSDVLSLGIDPIGPSTLYAGVRGSGVFKSTDGGASWHAINTGLPNPVSVQTVVIDPTMPSTLYVGTDRGVFQSTDGGENWLATNPLPPVTTMAIDPQTPSRLYAAGACTGAFRSDDEGGRWMAINRGLALNVFGVEVLPFLTSLVIDPLKPATLYAGALESIFKTTDRGANWRTVYVGFNFFLPVSGVTALVIDPVTPTTLYAGITGGGEFSGSGCNLSYSGLTSGVIKSVDGGGQWTGARTGLPSGVPVMALAIDPVLPSVVYAGTSQGVFKSSDGGGSWAAINEGLPDGATVRALAVDPQNSSILYAGTNQGVFKSTTGGDRWDATGSL